MPRFLWRKMCIDAGYPRNVKTCSSEAFHLLAAPHAPGNLTLVSHAGFPAQLQNTEQETLAHPVSSGHTAGCDSATAHTQPQHRAFRRHQPPGSTRAASLMLPRVNQDGKVTPVHASPLNTEVGDDSMLHTTSTGKVSLLLIMCPRANSAWTILYVHSKCLQQTFK